MLQAKGQEVYILHTSKLLELTLQMTSINLHFLCLWQEPHMELDRQIVHSSSVTSQLLKVTY